MSRAGVYCAANACIEQVIQHGEVDVFQAVHTVRRHRPQLTNNMVSNPIRVLHLIFVSALFSVLLVWINITETTCWNWQLDMLDRGQSAIAAETPQSEAQFTNSNLSSVQLPLKPDFTTP